MRESPQTRPFSSQVQLILEIAGLELPVAKSSPDRLTLVTPVDLAPAGGQLRMVIDGAVHRRDILLPVGATSESAYVRIEDGPAASANA